VVAHQAQNQATQGRFANKWPTWFVLLCLQQSDSPMAAAYLDKLNPDQRRAVEHTMTLTNNANHAGNKPVPRARMLGEASS
jgi:hypothetical protein